MITDLVVRLTMLLAAGWLVSWWALKKNPRWAVATTRLLALACLALPLVYAWRPAVELAVLPAQKIPAPRPRTSDGQSAHAVAPTAPPERTLSQSPPEDALPREAKASASPNARPAPPPPDEPSPSAPTSVASTKQPAAAPPPQAPPQPHGEQASLATVPTRGGLLAAWAAGVAAMLARTALRMHRTAALVRGAQPASVALQDECEWLAQRLNLRRAPPVLECAAVGSPCTTGWPRTALLLPLGWEADLSDHQRRAVLAHELSHVAGRDAGWDLVARLATALWWFHPLAWRLATRHRLACEHRCDAIAAQWAGGLPEYRRLLAAWTLRRRETDATAGALAMASGSLLARRLRRLEKPLAVNKLTRGRVAALLAAAALVLVGVASLRLTPRAAAQDAQEESAENPQPAEAPEDNQSPPQTPLIQRPGEADIDRSVTHPKTIHVVDNEGKPVKGARVRVGWWEDEEGDHAYVAHVSTEPLPTTGAEGTVTLDVPRGAKRAQLSVEADGYAGAGTQYSLAGEPRIELSPGRVVRVLATDADGEPLPDAIPILEDSRTWPREFEAVDEEPGLFVSPVVSLDRRWMRVVHAGDEGPLLFSDLIDVTNAETVDQSGAISAVLRSGVRLEGRLDDSVPRPIENGCVELYIKEAENHRIRRDEGWTWQDTADIKEDGAFTFESLPAGGHVQLVALVDGYQSVKPTAESLRDYMSAHDAGAPDVVAGATDRSDAFWPHLFNLPKNQAEVEVELPCTPTSAVDVTVVDPLGQPIEGATVRFNPNGYFLGGELFIPGIQFWTEANRVRSVSPAERSARTEWADSTFVRVPTGADGVAHVRNLPADERESYRVDADGYVMPEYPLSSGLGNPRYAIVELKGGQMLRRTITMERFVPRSSRELLVVNDKGEPVSGITLTLAEVALEGTDEDWQMWSVQRFGPITSGETDEGGLARLDVPVEVQSQAVAGLRVIVQGRMGRNAYVQRKKVSIPPKADGKVIALALSETPPTRPGQSRGVEARYVNPDSLLEGSPRELLERLVDSPSLVLLNQLLAAADFGAVTPLAFKPERNVLSPIGGDRRPVVRVSTESGERIVALCDVRPQNASWELKPDGAFPPEAAFVFDPSDGALVAVLGGWASARGDYCSATLTDLGVPGDLFVECSAFEEHGPFRYTQKWTRLGLEDRTALTVYGYANATMWSATGGRADAEYGYTGYEFNGRDIDDRLPGALPNGARAPRKIYWDGAQNMFVGPQRMSFEDEPLLEVVLEESAAFEPLDLEPGEPVVAGGRRGEGVYSWDALIPQLRRARVRVLLADPAAPESEPTEVTALDLDAGLHSVYLKLSDATDEPGRSVAELRVDGQDQQQTLSVPRVSFEQARDGDQPPVVRSVWDQIDLLRRPTVDEGQTLVLRLTLE